MLSSVIGSSLQLLTLVSATEAGMLQLRGQTVGDTVQYAWVHSSVLPLVRQALFFGLVARLQEVRVVYYFSLSLSLLEGPQIPEFAGKGKY